MKTSLHILGACAIAMCASFAAAQNFPSKPITLVVPNPPGGFVDASARILSDSLAKLSAGIKADGG